MPKLAHEVGGESRRTLGADHAQIRSEFGKGDEIVQAKKAKKRLSVKGRVFKGRIVYDIFRVTKDGLASELVAADFDYYEEAVMYAGDSLRGALSVSFGGMRGIFGRAARGSSLLSPKRNIVLPDDAPVKTVRVSPEEVHVIE